MVRFGRVSSFDFQTQSARVFLPDDEIVTEFLPIASSSAKNDKSYKTFSINQLVAVWLDENAEDGVVLGAIYDENTSAPASSGQHGFAFSDGGKIYWDSGKLVVEKTLTKFEVGSGGVKIERAGDTLKSAMTDLLTQIQAITVITTAFGTPSSVPVNAPAIAAILLRIQNILQ